VACALIHQIVRGTASIARLGEERCTRKKGALVNTLEAAIVSPQSLMPVSSRAASTAELGNTGGAKYFTPI
jgi:hypothetical protein